MKHMATCEAWYFGEVHADISREQLDGRTGLRAEYEEKIDTAARADHRAKIEQAAAAPTG